MKPLLFCAFLAASLGGCTSAHAPNNSPSASQNASPSALGSGDSVREIVPTGSTSFSSKKDGFAVWLPIKPVQTQKNTRLSNGETSTSFVYTSMTGVVNYAVLAQPVVPSELKADPKRRLDFIEQSSVTTTASLSPGAKVQEREKLQIGEFQGREWKTSLLNGAATTRTRLVSTPKVMYQIIAGGKTANIDEQSAQIKHVFDSFRVLPQ